MSPRGILKLRETPGLVARTSRGLPRREREISALAAGGAVGVPVEEVGRRVVGHSGGGRQADEAHRKIGGAEEGAFARGVALVLKWWISERVVEAQDGVLGRHCAERLAAAAVTRR